MEGANINRKWRNGNQESGIGNREPDISSMSTYLNKGLGYFKTINREQRMGNGH